MNLKLTLRYWPAILLPAFATAVSAQKLPSVQKEAVYAPVIKTDGKANEWNNKFSAHNNATGLFYTLANDDENLYLLMRTDQYSSIKKAFYGGITLSIKSADKKQEAKITYPLVAMTEHTEIVLPLRDKEARTDSLLPIVNEWIGKAAKKIAIAGLAGITDPDISVYNDLGIKAAALIDANRDATFEIQIPLKYIRHLMAGGSSFDYVITVNGAQLKPNTILIGGSNIDGNSHAPSAEPVNDIFTPTYLKGSYTLAKK
ncbi:hypothetical protein HQ865_18550 [Mucilaginibacter mali]|uniref:Uncharacterized protein n=1 Tax=Mucilaginibacter mali TaxID=2740462 RepID=A0A7D4UEG1_9SPHI|nr:hypothetical protein [Mucilaginibacter mali]QKJ31679.1 hypothetical protein HQ865_18550 [Mucilaginibacter mali]